MADHCRRSVAGRKRRRPRRASGVRRLDRRGERPREVEDLLPVAGGPAIRRLPPRQDPLLGLLGALAQAGRAIPGGLLVLLPLYGAQLGQRLPVARLAELVG